MFFIFFILRFLYRKFKHLRCSRLFLFLQRRLYINVAKEQSVIFMIEGVLGNLAFEVEAIEAPDVKGRRKARARLLAKTIMRAMMQMMRTKLTVLLIKKSRHNMRGRCQPKSRRAT